MKTLKKITVLLLALAMLVSLCACGGAKTRSRGDAASTTEASPVVEVPVSEAILGTWRYDVDLADYLMEYFAQTFESDTFETEESLNCPMLLTFNADGTFKMELDGEEIKANMPNFLTSIIPQLCEILYRQVEAEGMTREDLDAVFAESYGTTMEEYLASALTEMDMDDMLMDEGMPSEEGTYTIDGNRIYFVRTDVDENDETYLDFSLSGDELAITDFSDSEEAFSQLEKIGITLPLIFTRIE